MSTELTVMTSVTISSSIFRHLGRHLGVGFRRAGLACCENLGHESIGRIASALSMNNSFRGTKVVLPKGAGTACREVLLHEIADVPHKALHTMM
jgi:hypothetical protein